MDINGVLAIVDRQLRMHRPENIAHSPEPYADESFHYTIRFANVSSAATWYEYATKADPEPEVFGPAQFDQVRIYTKVSRFDEPIMVTARLRPEWIKWVIKVN